METTNAGTTKRRRRVPLFFRMIRKSPSGLIGLTIIMITLLMAVFAPYITPHDPLKHNLRQRWVPPSWAEGGDPSYLLGTDHMGRDILSRLILGSRVSVIVGICAVLVAGSLGMTIGLVAGFWGGIVDTIVGRTIDTFLAIPYLVFVIAVTGVLEGGVTTIIMVLGFTGWPTYARQIRGEVLSIKTRDYVEAIRATGGSSLRIIFRHVMPNAMGTMIVLATLNVAVAIMSESGLSFLGLGVQAPAVTWGSMLADGRDYLGSAWWLGTFPGLTITIVLLGVVFFGDFLRDYLDPRTIE